MGTFQDSKIVQARRQYPCELSRMPTPHYIQPGHQYLRYKLGQRNDRKICLACAMTRDMGGTGYLRFECRAVLDYIAATSTRSDK